MNNQTRSLHRVDLSSGSHDGLSSSVDFFSGGSDGHHNTEMLLDLGSVLHGSSVEVTGSDALVGDGLTVEVSVPLVRVSFVPVLGHVLSLEPSVPCVLIGNEFGLSQEGV